MRHVVECQAEVIGGLGEITGGGRLSCDVRGLVAVLPPVPLGECGTGRPDLWLLLGRPPLRGAEHTLGGGARFLAECLDTRGDGCEKRWAPWRR